MPTIPGTNGGETILGTNDDDVILARGGADTIFANGGNDVIRINATPNGSDVIDGGSGTDFVIIDGLYSTFTVSESGGSIIFTSTATGSSETLTNVEQFITDDQEVFIVGAGGYATIQAAVNAATPGSIIMIAGGTYVEQVTVSGKTGLTIMAIPGSTVTIQAPANVVFSAESSSGRDVNAVVTIINSTNVVLNGINVDGAGHGNTIDEGTGALEANFVGVFYRNATGGLENVDITGVRHPYESGTTVGGHPVLSGIQAGVGLQVDNDTQRAFSCMAARSPISRKMRASLTARFWT